MSDTHTVSIRFTANELAKLDELRPSGCSRSGFVRQLLRRTGPLEEVPTRREALALLAESARSGKTAAQIALARETRTGDRDAVMDWILDGG